MRAAARSLIVPRTTTQITDMIAARANVEREQVARARARGFMASNAERVAPGAARSANPCPRQESNLEPSD